MFSTDKVTVTGTVARSEMRYTPSGQAVLEFGVPVDRSYKPDGASEYVKRTIWYSVVVWGRFAETLNKRVSKGVFVHVNGELQPDWNTGSPRTYQKQDGTYGAKYEVKAREVTINGEPQQVPASQTEPRDYASGDLPPDDEIPF
jgi:single-strand DNA-binding protein